MVRIQWTIHIILQASITNTMSGPPPPKKRKNASSGAPDGDSPNEFEEVMGKMKGTTDREVALKAAKKLKAMLPNGAKIKDFVSHKKNLEDLVAVFTRETSLLGTSMYQEDLHKYSISILANCCYTDKSTSTGTQIRKASRGFLDQAVRIFESTTSNIEIRVSMCRLIGNLCNNKDLVTSWLSSNTILFDRIALLLESTNDNLVTQCLRIFLSLSNHSFTRVSYLHLFINYKRRVGGMFKYNRKKLQTELRIPRIKV
ncbi:hypothetical protein CRE_14274 [Caenorhabditis remanei]|uniref:Uncharacterized protein n=1 Tax=Caenorhabditis remanei TaxID=31234 RepID=E3N7N9_CAERE|nr:hypothetical protein CRE_14274 [Caenorhabditis remanei]